VIVLVMTAVMAVVDHQGRAGIISEMERRGEALARNFAAISYGPLLLYNFTALEQNVARMAAEHDVVYAVVLDADGKVAAHSRYPERVGFLLHGAVPERAASASEPLTQETVTTAGEVGRLATAFNDMAAQLLHQRTALEEAHGGLRRQFEELADLKSYTDNILGSLTSGIVTIDLGGRVVTLNLAAELLTGFFRGEAAGRYCTELFAHTPEISDLLTETLATRAPIASVPLTLRRRNGTILPIEFSTAPLKG